MDSPAIQYAKTTDGCDIAFTTTGAGPPLVLVWGFSELRLRWTSPLFRGFFAHLSKEHLLVQYEPRGQGLSTRGLPSTASLDDFVLDLEAVIDQLGRSSVVLMGLTLCAKIALRFAIQHQNSTQALILWNCDPGSPVHGAYGSGRPLAKNNWDYLIESSSRATFPQDDYEIQRAMKVDVITPSDFLVTVDALASGITHDDLASLDVPCLILATRASSWSFANEEQSKRLAGSVRGARLEIFDDVGGGLFSLDEPTPPGIESVLDFIRSSETRSQDNAEGILSSREAQVLQLVASGKTNQEIADELGISRNTVRSHVSSILVKVGAKNRAQAVAKRTTSGASHP